MPILLPSYRSLTTPSTDTTPETTRPDLSHLKSVPPRKQKIELRPGPVKTPPPSQAITSSVTNFSPADTAEDTKSVDSPIPGLGIVETAKVDYSEASRHGILAPPPPDASMIGRLWHQAKEYFVCCGEPVAQHPNTHRRFSEILFQGLETRYHPPKTSQPDTRQGQIRRGAVVPMGDPVHRDPPCRRPQVRLTPLLLYRTRTLAHQRTD